MVLFRIFCSATRFLLYGYMTFHWSLLYGHHPGVYANMTNTEVREADKRGADAGYLIHVQDHKTARTFGEAQLPLRVEEFGWVQRWVEIKGALLGPQKRYFLFTTGKNPSRNLSSYLRMTWDDAGLSGDITYTDLCTALADNVS